jgi:hypothetical protein
MDDLFGKRISEFPELRFLPFPQGKEVKATVYPSRRSIMCRLTCSPTSLPPVIDRYYHFVPDGFRPGGTCRFVPVTGLALEDWFSLPSRDQHEGGTGDGLNVRVLGEPLITGRSQRGFSSFPADDCGRPGSLPRQSGWR